MLESPGTQLERVLFLKTFDAFKNLSPEELTALAENTRPQSFETGAALGKPSLPVRTLHFILQGRVEVVKEGQPTAILGPQDVVGGLAVLIGDERGQLVRALEPTSTLKLRREDLEDVFEDNFAVLLGVLGALARAQLALRRTLGREAGYPAVQSAAPARPLVELGLVERLFCLRRAMDFAQTRVDALSDLAEDARTLRAEAGEALWEIGDLAENNLLVVEGVITAATQDSEQVFEFGPGSFVGGVDVFAGEPRWYRATCKTPVVGLRIRTQHLLDVVEDHIDLGMDLLRVLARMLAGLQGGAPSAAALAQPLR
jgi:CRP-like cAMP-binding protein